MSLVRVFATSDRVFELIYEECQRVKKKKNMKKKKQKMYVR